MIHMDVDSHPAPSYRRRYVSAKRARSPEPLISHDRPSKKAALGIERLDTFHAVNNTSKRLGDTSTGSSRHSSEDWVQQAGGLTIDSPVCAGSNFSELEEAERIQRDEDMVMEYTYHDPTMQLERPRLPLLQTCGYTPFTSVNSDGVSHSLNSPSLPSATMSPAGHIPFQAVLPLSVYERRQPLVSTSNPVIGPAINVVPPTPMELQAIHGCHLAGSPLGQLESNASSQNTITPSSPKTPLTSKRQRFAMGPRADCEKCRLGIKGHFVHLD